MPDLGRAVVEDLARAAFFPHAMSSRQPDPAETAPSPEDGTSTDERAPTGAAEQAAPVAVATPS